MKNWHFEGQPSRGQLDEICAVIARGGVVLLPTDTIYGLHALATHQQAVDRIGEMKGRADVKPFVVLGASRLALEEIGVSIPPEVREMLDSLWPAPLTAILPLSQPIAASRGLHSLAARVPASDWLRELLRRTGPLVSTSANRAGEIPITMPSQLASDLQNALDGLADAGPQTGEPSTLVDFTGHDPRILREGEISFTQKVWKRLRKSL